LKDEGGIVETIFHILGSLPVIFFWSAVLAFVPVAYYLLIKNPPLLKAERMREKGIIVLGQEGMARKAETTRTKGVFFIYGLCVIFFSTIYLFNASHNQAGVKPFDILSTVSVILFSLSILTYLPFVYYLILKNPWQDREESVCLTGIFIGYGGALLVFSVVFAIRWLKVHQIPIGLAEIFSAFLIMLFSAMVIAYLPICFYVFSKIANPHRWRPIHPNVIFVIYSLCLLVFASVFIANWVADKRLTSEVRPARPAKSTP